MFPDKLLVADALFLALAILHFVHACADCDNMEQVLTHMYSPLYLKSIRVRADACQQLIISYSLMARHDMFLHSCTYPCCSNLAND